MVKQRTGETGGGMTGDAIFRRWNMRFSLTSGTGRDVVPVMTDHTVTVDSLMVEGGTGKSVRGMTDLTTQASRNMPQGFADRRNTVTGIATVGDVRMVNPGTDKTAGPMAYTTILVSLYVVWRLALGKHTVMA